MGDRLETQVVVLKVLSVWGGVGQAGKIKKLLNIWPYAYGLKHGLKCINIFVVLTFLFSLSNIPLELSLITICYVCSRLAQN